MTQEEQWSRLLRGTMLSSLMDKNIAYVEIVDARARTLITICAVLLPLLISALNYGVYLFAIGVAILSSLVAMVQSIVVLMPKQVVPSKKGDLDYSPTHFTSYAQVDEERYLKDMLEIISDHGKHTEHFVRDLYHVGRDVLQPKNSWQRAAYLTFIIGNGLAVIVAGIEFIIH